MPERFRAMTWAGAVLALVVLALGNTTEARWADGTAVSGTDVRSGSIDLEVGGDGPGMLDVVPGAVTTSELTIGNAGTVRFGYRVDVAGTDGGHGLFGALAIDVLLGDCAGPSVGTGRVLAPGDTAAICVRAGLPAGAPASVAGAASDLTVTVTATRGSWVDSAQATRSSVTTVPLVAPSLSCGVAGLGSIALQWEAVPHATAYRVHYGPGGSLVETVPASTLGRLFVGVAGVASVEAVFGSDAWRSAPSAPMAYSALAGLLGTCG